jgi:DNA-binding transcriptional LysR family regulator
LKRPEDLAQHVLLHIDDERGRFTWLNWSAWLAAIGIHHLTPVGSLRFNHFDQVIQAAVDGQGVALGREPLIDHLLQQRKLVAPFPDRYATPRAYYIVRASHAALRPEAQAFSDWLQEEARADALEGERPTDNARRGASRTRGTKIARSEPGRERAQGRR